MLGRPVTVGFIGAGNVLPAYLQVLDRLGPRGLATVGPVHGRNPSALAELRRRRPSIELCNDVEGVLQADVDVVVVITPPGAHAELAQRALESGKHVLVEKPFAETRAAGEELARAANERGLHLVAAPFVQLAPTFRMLWTLVDDGAVGHPHSARGLYGNAGSHWATWYHTGRVGPFAELGVYNVKSLTALLGPVVEVLAAEATAVRQRNIAGTVVSDLDPDVSHVILRHADGALSTVTSSQAIQRYRCPGLEVYGTEGTANLLGDDWDPRGLEVWRNEAGSWEVHEPVEPTWLWADGLRELVLAIHEDRQPLVSVEHDLHLLDVIDAVALAATERAAIPVSSSFGPLDLRYDDAADRTHLHDHTRPADEQ